MHRLKDFDRLFKSSSKSMNDFFPMELEIKGKKEYPSGSSYDGTFSQPDHYWEGEGEYTFPHKVLYTGTFDDSQFDGEGTFSYPMGQTLIGEWVNGSLVLWCYAFEDGLEYDEQWDYCIFPNRTFYSTLKDEFAPPGSERVTNLAPSRPIPPGCYDVGEGFYNPKVRGIVSAETKKILRIPTPEETIWIQKYCRYADDNIPIGYRPDLYEFWCTGTRLSVGEILSALSDQENRSRFDEELDDEY